MSTSISTLSQKVQEEIVAINADQPTIEHIPVAVYGKEMKDNSLLLIEHAPIYKEKIRFDTLPLAAEMNLVADALHTQEHIWKTKMYEHEKEARFWFDNQDRLYTENITQMARLDFFFSERNNSEGLAVLTQIGTSDNDTDAVDDGRRFKLVLKEYANKLEGDVYTAAELEGLDIFYTEIEKSRTAATLDRTAQNSDRILRDQIYLYLRKLETRAMKAAKATFATDEKEFKRYSSAYYRQKYLKAKRAEEAKQA